MYFSSAYLYMGAFRNMTDFMTDIGVLVRFLLSVVGLYDGHSYFGLLFCPSTNFMSVKVSALCLAVDRMAIR